MKHADEENKRNAKISVRNTSGYKGVSRSSKYSHWRATICVNGKNKVLGHSEDPAKAAALYAVAAKHYFGDFARLQ